MPTSDEIDNLIKQLSNRDKAERINAKLKLSRLGAEAVPTLLKFVQQEWKQYVRHQLFLRKFAMALSPVGMVIFSVAMFLKPTGVPKTEVPQLAYLGIGLTVFGGILMYVTAGMPNALSAAYEILIDARDPRTFPTMLECFIADNSFLSAQSLQIMGKLLPFVSLSEWQCLSVKQRKGFYRIVQTNATWKISFVEEFSLAALTALEQIGDAEAIPTVERIAKKGRSESVRQAARECLPYLQVRHEEQTKRETLLRASEATGGKDELLRVPAQTHLSESEQLLRVPKEEG